MSERKEGQLLYDVATGDTFKVIKIKGDELELENMDRHYTFKTKDKDTSRFKVKL